ncbi:MbcA/ParS/Xre antitoxin family protein [Altererythrobacter sp. C41]|uniref:MbcA/ParS/Xre antitoxin family protein n=1 Tax=Altererythrobacter sp. C41 TaxID=2806021 RepID=UPI001931E4CB|nr:MbcA/ParS/Xre antitoxin family protein [Altererythrobacter sp. C41]MBM0169530.1 DUF2384 domain-containing protein [Altererythrobacter sp. C41]
MEPTFQPDPVLHGGAGLRTFLNIAEQWSLSNEEQMRVLGIHDPVTFADWKVRVRAHEAFAIPMDVIVRIGCVLSIYASLATLFPDEQATVWLRAPNTGSTFRRRTPLALITSGELEDLERVARYLLGRIHN